MGDGEALLDALEEGRYDIVVADLQMPRMGGLEALRLHRVMAAGEARLPWLVLSANATREAMEESEEAGADAYLSKPVDAATLVATVASLAAGPVVEAVSGARADAPDDHADAGDSLLDERVLGHVERLGGGPGFLDDLFEGFVTDARELVQRISTAVAAQRWRTARDDLHALRGSSGSVGAQRLCDACADLSRHCQAQDAAAAATAADALEELLERTAAAFAARRRR